MPPAVTSLDHLVLTVANLDETCAFYADALGMQVSTFTAGDGTYRHALLFGAQKINLHQAGAEFEPKARYATKGSADLCFLSTSPLQMWQTHLTDLNIPIESGPVPRTGATSPILSIYVRDPDGNLIEISNTQ